MSSVPDGDVLSVEREREACRGGRSIESGWKGRYLGGEEEINQEVRVCLGELRTGDTEREWSGVWWREGGCTERGGRRGARNRWWMGKTRMIDLKKMYCIR